MRTRLLKINPIGKLLLSTVLLAATGVLGTGTSSAANHPPRTGAGQDWGGPVALAAGRVYLVENAQLHLSKEDSLSIGERGQATGTFDAPATCHLNLTPRHVTAFFTIYPKGGSISGTAQASYVVRNSIGYYGGALTITGGTGTYRHASGTNIGISGTISHLTYALTVKAHGWVNL